MISVSSQFESEKIQNTFRYTPVTHFLCRYLGDLTTYCGLNVSATH